MRRTENLKSEHSYSMKNAFNGCIQDRTLYPHHEEKYDLLTFFANTKQDVINFLNARLNQQAIKWYLSVQVDLVKNTIDGEQVQQHPHFRSITFTTLHEETLNEDINEAYHKMFKLFEEYMKDGSDLILYKVISLTIHTVKYRPIKCSIG